MAVTISTDVVVPCRADRARKRLDATLSGCTRRDYGRTSVSDLRWVPTGRLGSLYPTYQTGIAVTAIDDTSCLLTVAGVYRPPLGRFGRIADRAVMHRLAESTATDFTARLGRVIAHDALPADEGEGSP